MFCKVNKDVWGKHAEFLGQKNKFNGFLLVCEEVTSCFLFFGFGC